MVTVIIIKMLLNVIGILCFVRVLSADQISVSSEKIPYLLQENTITPNTDVQNASKLLGYNTKSRNDTVPVWSHRPIALEGGSSVVANDTKFSDSISAPIKSSTADRTRVVTSKPQTLFTSSETKGKLTPRPSATVESNSAKTDGSDTTYFSKDPLQLTLEESDHPSVVPRKGVSPKIVPRKGVDPYEPIPFTNNNDTEIKPSECSCCETLNRDQQHENFTSDQKCTLCCNTSDSEAFNISSSVGGSKADNNTSRADAKNQVSGTKVNADVNEADAYRTSPPPKKKAKPLITLGDDGEEKQILMRSSSSENNDFVIPVVLVILAVPIAIVLAMIFYRKGTEFWERRHYKRMDFLIDGMYND